MENKRFEQLAIIRDELLSDPYVPGLTIWQAAKIAEEDDYLNNLMIDWAKETDTLAKSQMLKEIIDYTDEMLRQFGNKE